DRLHEAGIAIPKTVRFLPLDLLKGSLARELAAAGFDAAVPAQFSMLGIVILLPKTIVMTVLEFVASMPEGSGLVFDYVILESALEPGQRAIRQAAAKRSAAIGEPFLTFLDPQELDQKARRLGFTTVQDLDFQQINQRYFDRRTDGLHVASGG